MVHNIFIALETNPERIIEGSQFRAIFTVKNIGDQAFPGGKISKIVVRYPDAVFSTLTVTDFELIPRLEINETWTHGSVFRAIAGGTAWIEVKIEPEDKVNIVYFQNIGSPLATEHWEIPFRVRTLENHETLMLLEKILEKLDSLDKKPWWTK